MPSHALGRIPTAMTTSVHGITVPSASSTASTLRSPRIALGCGLGDDLDAASLDRALQEMAGSRIELPLHQRRHQMQHGDVHAALFEPGRSFEAEQSAADHHGLGARLRGKQHRLHVVEIAIGQDARKVVAGNRQNERRRAGRDDQFVVGGSYATIGRHGLRSAVDRDDLVALVERDAVLDVPAVAVDDDLLVALFAGKNRRQHDAVIIDARLGVEDRDFVAPRSRFEQMLEHSARRHSVSDDDEFFSHVRAPPDHSAA